MRTRNGRREWRISIYGDYGWAWEPNVPMRGGHHIGHTTDALWYAQLDGERKANLYYVEELHFCPMTVV